MKEKHSSIFLAYGNHLRSSKLCAEMRYFQAENLLNVAVRYFSMYYRLQAGTAAAAAAAENLRRNEAIMEIQKHSVTLGDGCECISIWNVWFIYDLDWNGPTGGFEGL